MKVKNKMLQIITNNTVVINVCEIIFYICVKILNIYKPKLVRWQVGIENSVIILEDFIEPCSRFK